MLGPDQALDLESDLAGLAGLVAEHCLQKVSVRRLAWAAKDQPAGAHRLRTQGGPDLGRPWRHQLLEAAAALSH